MIYGLVAPGYEMARSWPPTWPAASGSSPGPTCPQAQLMGIDVASFGDYEIKPEQATPLVYEDRSRI